MKKKSLLTTLITGLLFLSCDNYTFPLLPLIYAFPQEITLDDLGTKQNITLESTTTWTVLDFPDWITLHNVPEIKEGGKFHIQISAEQNHKSKGRYCEISFQATGGNTSVIKVWQRPYINVLMVAGGSGYSLALKSDSTVWAWGRNVYGVVGNGSLPNNAIVRTPSKVNNLAEVTAIAAGNTHALALNEKGIVWAWGDNLYGQLGRYNNMGRERPNPTPQRVVSLLDVTAIAGGLHHSLALREDGTVWAWGNNRYGQLGNSNHTGSDHPHPTPVQVAGLVNVTAIAAGYNYCLALMSDGTVWAWGDNRYGQLGTGSHFGSHNPRPIPVQVQNLSGVTAIAAGSTHALALKEDGTVWAWGENNCGQIGDHTRYNRFTPVQVLSKVTEVYANYQNSFAIKSDDTVLGWGRNNFGQLGDGTTTHRSTPVLIDRLSEVMAISGELHTLALKSNGTVWVWGRNNYGQLGIGNTTDRIVPVRLRPF